MEHHVGGDSGGETRGVRMEGAGGHVQLNDEKGGMRLRFRGDMPSVG
jgi:hypothetical protein